MLYGRPAGISLTTLTSRSPDGDNNEIKELKKQNKRDLIGHGEVEVHHKKALMSFTGPVQINSYSIQLKYSTLPDKYSANANIFV